MRRIVWPIVLAVFFLASGCTLSPKYTRPKAPIPAGWPQGAAYKRAKVPSGAPMAPELNWQDFFTDPKLQNIIEMALKNNRDLKLAALNVAYARALYGVQRAELFPTVGAAGSESKHRSATDLTHPGEPRTTKQFSVDLGITSWEIDFFGRIRSLEQRALEQYLATEEARRSAQIALISEVARAYLALAADRENLKLARDTLETQQASYNLIEKLYKAGLATELDLRRAQTRMEAAKRDIPRYTQLAALDLNALNLLAGSPVPETLLPDNLESVKAPRVVSPGLPSEVLLKRPDIMAAEHQLKAAYALIGAARAAFFPRITLTTGVGTASDELSGLFSSGNGTWIFAPRVAMPIFDARTWAAYRVSKANREIALTQYERAIQTAFREVADALAIHGTINDEVMAQQSLVQAAEKTYELSKNRYLIGLDSYLSVLDSQRTLYIQKQILTQLKLARSANQVRLYAVLGGGADQPNVR